MNLFDSMVELEQKSRRGRRFMVQILDSDLEKMLVDINELVSVLRIWADSYPNRTPASTILSKHGFMEEKPEWKGE